MLKQLYMCAFMIIFLVFILVLVKNSPKIIKIIEEPFSQNEYKYVENFFQTI